MSTSKLRKSAAKVAAVEISLILLAATFVATITFVNAHLDGVSAARTGLEHEVYVEAYDVSGEMVWVGSGVVVDDKVVATAGHLVRSDDTVQLDHLVVYRGTTSYRTTIWAKHDSADVALLYVDGLSLKTYPITRPIKMVRVGEELTVVGHPAGLRQPWVTEGRLASGPNTDIPLWKSVYGSDVAVFGGSSGSGVYDSKGRLVGILVGKMGPLSLIENISTIYEIGKDRL